MIDDDHLDELASAYLDGATTPEEAARVEADAELLARVETLRSVRSALAITPTVDAERREHGIAAALAAFDDEAGAEVRPLPPVSARRRASPRRWRALGVAAAIAALVALVPLLAAISPPADEDSASNSEAADHSLDSAATPDTSAAPAEALVTTTAPGGSGYAALGSFETDGALVAAVREQLARTGSTPSQGDLGRDLTSCASELARGLPAGEPLVLTAQATVAGEPVAFVATTTQVRIVGGDCTEVRTYDR